MAKTAEEYFNAGNEKAEQGDHAGAIADFNKAIESDANNANSYNNRGVAKKNLGQYIDAIADYDEAIRLNPNYADAYNNRGNAKVELKQYEEAITDFNKAIKLEPDDADAYSNRGLSKAKLGQYEVAIADYDEAIRLKPDFAEAYNNRGNAKAELKQYEAAIADYDEAIRLKPDFANAIYNRAGVEIEKQQRQQQQGILEGLSKQLEAQQTKFEDNLKAKEKGHCRWKIILIIFAVSFYSGVFAFFGYKLDQFLAESIFSLVPLITLATLMLVPFYFAERRAARDKDQALALCEATRTNDILVMLIQGYSNDQDNKALLKLFDYHIQSGLPALILGKDSPPIMPSQEIIERVVQSNKPGD